MIIQKQYARRNIEGYVSPYERELGFLSISSIPTEDVLRVLGDAMAGSAGRDYQDGTAEAELGSIIEFAGDAYHPETWVIGFDNDKPVGVVFAQRYHDKLNEGSLFFIGVTPEFRGKGFGKLLHAKGLEMLAGIGVKEYVGSTDVLNLAMIRIFEANECKLYTVRDVEIKAGLV